jgi:hypothetical protein
MQRLREAVIVVAVATGVALMAGCETQGPTQKTGERVDRALDQDRVFAKGPVEKGGKKVDQAVDEVRR